MSKNHFNKAAVTPENCPQLKAIREFKENMIGNHNFSDTADVEEVLELKNINLPKEDLVLFNNSESYSVLDMIQVSELQNHVIGVFRDIFYDVFNVKFMKMGQYNKYIFVISFKYTPEVNEDGEKKIRCITSSINPDDKAGNSIANNLMMLTDQQQTSSSDASKYAKITKEAKELLTDLLIFGPNNKKRKWVKNENYTLDAKMGTAFNGVPYNNIIGSVFLDANKVLEIVCGTKDEKGKYDYNIIPAASNITNTDSIIKIEKVNKKRKNQIANKYGISFQ